MNREEKIPMIREMLRLIALGSHDMPNYVFSYFIKHKIPTEQKCFYNLIADTFLTLYSFSSLMNDNCWSQASTLLRMALEQVSAVFVMAYQKESIKDYVNLQKEKNMFLRLNEKEQKEYAKNNGFRGREYAYFDYGWIKRFTDDKTYGRIQLMKLAHLEEFTVDIDQTLNSFSHGSITIFQFDKDNWDVMKRYGDRITIACCKLFDFLCCSYKYLIGEEFLCLPLNSVFLEFKSIYQELFIKEGWKK